MSKPSQKKLQPIGPAALLLAAALSLFPTGSAVAQPLAAVELLFSDDGGSTYQDAIIVSPGEHYRMRIYFDNTGNAAGTAASVTATLPAGFSRVGGTTLLCLEPQDGERRCSGDAGMAGAIVESAVWSGQSLAISPTAGFFGQSAAASSGILEMGKKRYLNLHECQYHGGSDRIFLNADPAVAGTGADNTAAAAASCASGGIPGYALSSSRVLPLDLLGFRYLNYHECEYEFFGDRIFVNADSSLVGTATENTADLAPACAGSAGSHNNVPAESQVAALDLLGRRYLNLNECRYQSGGDTFAANATSGNNTNTSAIPDAAATCIPVAIGHNLTGSLNLAIDLLDSGRGRGFVEVEVQAGAAGSYPQSAAIDTAEGAPATDSTILTVTTGVPPGPVPSVDIKYSHAKGYALMDDAMAAAGEIFVVRVYYDNRGVLPGTAAALRTELPAGIDRIPGTTRVCLEPTAAEQECNTVAIDETSVWSGQVLEIAPTAGLQGEDEGATAGLLEIGRKRWLNLEECHYYNGFDDRVFANAKPGITGTHAGNTAAASATCAASLFGRNRVGGYAQAFDLMGKRWLNLHECQYHFFFFDRIVLNSTAAAGSNTANVEDAVPVCAPTAGAHSLLPAESWAAGIDLRGQRWLNLHECFLRNGEDYVGINTGDGVGTNASTSEDHVAVCPASSGSHTLEDASVLPIDLLDTTRGRGFVEFLVQANLPAGIYPEDAELETAEVAPATDDGDIVVVPGLLFKDGFEPGDTSRWSKSEP